MKLKLLLILIILTIFKIKISFGGEICSNDYKCGIKGAKCGKSQKECSPGFYCGNSGLCVEGKLEDGRCNSNKECSLGFKCINQGQYRVCKPSKLYGLGERCLSSSECLGSLLCTKGICKLKKLNNCSMNEDCDSNSYCNKFNQCVQRLPMGADCLFKVDQCTQDAICGMEDGRSNYLQGKCVPLFSKSIGQSCYATQFGECDMEGGLYCPTTSGLVSSCAEMVNGKQTCKSNKDCDTFWQECECSGKSSNSTCNSKFNIDATCSKLYTNLQQCLKGSQCSVVNDINGIHETNANSCVMKNCQQHAVCFYSRCLRFEFGGCKLPDSLKCIITNSTSLENNYFLNYNLESRNGTYNDTDDLTLKPIKPKDISNDEISQDNNSSADENNDSNNNNTSNNSSNNELKPKNNQDNENSDKNNSNSKLNTNNYTFIILLLICFFFFFF
ncbi:hypothetical protein DDB_G0267620 [Dictyostelium discoideum AX4]|uniref:Dickkopf N-terminal cysteine-rich domain-containing protein n=1 Tax=Dictyostelium discoideum TaxID=44689 RepID=Q55GL3_DICDI|nr:hypothetical protein DDB_G0267620 [Dictyostelium discoideum AX4]EAL73263.1 hypothetical protein DDB_G0267620 [Dictyostelium discoideum AX4]|eukprot:XP_647171.1 hypothetical protein DDB_G0267620 [Dictyostelium discoideum AX4]